MIKKPTTVKITSTVPCCTFLCFPRPAWHKELPTQTSAFLKAPFLRGCDTLPTTDASPAFNNMTLQHFRHSSLLLLYPTQTILHSIPCIYEHSAPSLANTDKILDFTWTTLHTNFLHLKRHYPLFPPSFPLSDKQWQLAYTYP